MGPIVGGILKCMLSNFPPLIRVDFIVISYVVLVFRDGGSVVQVAKREFARVTIG